MKYNKFSITIARGEPKNMRITYLVRIRGFVESEAAREKQFKDKLSEHLESLLTKVPGSSGGGALSTP